MGNYRIIDNEAEPVLESGPGSRSRVLAGAANGTTCMAVVERWLDPGAEVSEHRHPEGIEEVIWIRAGRGEFSVEGEQAELGPDTTLVIPPLARHSFRSTGEEPLSLFTRYSAAVPTMLADDGSDAGPEVPGAV